MGSGIVKNMLEVHYFAAARAAAGCASETVESPATLGALVDALSTTHTGTTDAGMSFAEVAQRCTFLVDGLGAGRNLGAVPLDGVKRVDVLPPFAGG